MVSPQHVVEAEKQTRPSPMRWIVPVAVAGITFLVFVRTLWNGFVNWDDFPTLVNNPHYRGFAPENLLWMLTSFKVGHWRPLTWLSFAVDHLFWGMNPMGYHLTNVLLHAGSAAVFCLVIHRLLRIGGCREDRAGTLWLWSGVGALLFSVHPLRTECVAWATDRLDVLSGLWWMLTVWAYLRARGGPTPRNRWLIGAAALYALSLMSKGIGMTLPAVLLILDVYPLGRLGGGRGRWVGRAVRSVWLEKIPFFLLAAGGGAMAFLAKQERGGMLPVERLGVLKRIAQMAYNQAFYTWKTIWPTELVPLYEMRLKFDPWDWPFALSGAVVVAITVALLALCRRWPAGLAAWACYLIMLLPVSGLLQSGTQIAADRYSYLSCLGWPVLFAAGMGRWCTGRRQAIGLGASCVLVSIFAWLSYQQTHLWRDSETLWRYTVAVRPGGGAHNNLGVALSKKKRIEDAREEFQRAVEYQPHQYEWQANLGDALYKLDRKGEAMAAYEEALRFNPKHVKARTHLIRILLERREYDRVFRIGRDGLEHSPDEPDLMNTLAWVLATCPVAAYRDGFEAVLLAQEAVKLTGELEPTYLGTLAAALAEAGDFNEAVSTAKRAITLAEQKGKHEMADEMRERLELYVSEKPYHEQ